MRYRKERENGGVEGMVGMFGSITYGVKGMEFRWKLQPKSSRNTNLYFTSHESSQNETECTN